MGCNIPKVQETLRAELDAFPGEPRYEDFQSKLPYLDAVLRETCVRPSRLCRLLGEELMEMRRLRLYPGLAYMERTAVKDDVIPLRKPFTLRDGTRINEVAVSKGQVRSPQPFRRRRPIIDRVHGPQTVIIPTISLQRLDAVWHDGDAFRPERWLEALPPAEKMLSGWSNTLAFSNGPRNCIGFRLGEHSPSPAMVGGEADGARSDLPVQGHP